MKEYDIFISYCRKDIAKAKRIKEDIERNTSAKCWMDLDGIESGSQFEDVVISAIDNARIVVFLLSENSMKSKWTKDEVRYAYETKKKIIPVNIDRCAPSGWFLFKFSGYDVIDINDPYQQSKLFSNLSNWTENEESEEKPSNRTSPTNRPPHRFYELFWISQYIAWGLILLIMSSMFFFGLLTMKEGTIAMRYNILLCICLCLTLYSFYLLSAKHQKKALLYISILDIVVIILLCAISKRVYGYAVLRGHHYQTFPYIQINGLGWEMIHKGKVLVTLLMELFAIMHISMIICVLFIRIKGYRLWDRLR